MTFHAIMPILLGSVELFYWICVYYLRRNPNLNWPKIFLIPIGPRTNVFYMNRRELFKSTTSFLFWGIHFTITFVIVSYLIFGVVYKNSEPHIVLVAITFFAFPVACGMCYLAAAYLFIRGIFRSHKYVPKGCVMIHGSPLALDYIMEIIDEYKGKSWHKAEWHKRPAIVSKDGGGQQLYIGQHYDTKFFDLDPFGWDHDHCEICWWTICDQKDHEKCSTEGYTNGID